MKPIPITDEMLDAGRVAYRDFPIGMRPIDFLPLIFSAMIEAAPEQPEQWRAPAGAWINGEPYHNNIIWKFDPISGNITELPVAHAGDSVLYWDVIHPQDVVFRSTYATISRVNGDGTVDLRYNTEFGETGRLGVQLFPDPAQGACTLLAS